MSLMKRNRGFYPAAVLFLGLMSAQAPACIQVYLSNADLYESLRLIQERGYLSLPNQIITESLLHFGPAFYGGVFFTLSVGAGLSGLTLAAVWAWDRLFSRSKIVLIPFVIIWAGSVYAVNSQGISLLITSYFLVVPVVVITAALKLMPEQSGKSARVKTIVHLTSFAVIALLCASQIDRDIFVDFRDNFFLSNPIGSEMNDFYYKYTLYAAEVIKPLDQQTLKTGSVEEVSNQSLMQQLRKELLNYNYLAVSDYPAVDLRVVEKGESLLFENDGRTILTTTADAFFSNPEAVLKEFSLKSDRVGFFRYLIFIFILTGLPLIVYIFLYSFFRLAASFFISSTASSVTAFILCLLAGAALVVPLEMNNSGKISVNELDNMLKSGSRQDRVAALKVIEKRGLEITDYSSYRGILESPYAAERYWLVKALGVSGSPETFKDLSGFLDDPHPNVVCMAFLSLGRRGDAGTIREIIPRIERSGHWYEQLYAYNALMELGWRQTISD